MKLWVTGTGNFPTSTEYVIITNYKDYCTLMKNVLPQMADEDDIIRDLTFADAVGYGWQNSIEIERQNEKSEDEEDEDYDDETDIFNTLFSKDIHYAYLK